jgi:hypothetical protein
MTFHRPVVSFTKWLTSGAFSEVGGALHEAETIPHDDLRLPRLKAQPYLAHLSLKTLGLAPALALILGVEWRTLLDALARGVPAAS